MLKKFFVTMFGFSLLSTQYIYNQIIEIESIKEAWSALEHLDNQALVLFDIDETLITPEDHILKKPYQQQYLVNYLNDTLGYDCAEELRQVVWSSFKNRLLDDYLLPTIASLQSRAIKTIALTGSWTGKVGVFDCYEQHRVNQLRAVGIDFTSAFPEHTHIVLPVTTNIGRFPVFHHGAICACEAPKYQVLDAFLTQIGYAPSTIVFFDDMKHYLDDMETYCKQKNIPFIGFHCIATVKQMALLAFDEKRALQQITHLMQYKEWISDDRYLQIYGS